MKLSALNYYKSNPSAAYTAGGAYIAKKGSTKVSSAVSAGVKYAKASAKKTAAENAAKTTGGAYIAAQGTKKYKNQYVAAWAAKWAK